MKADLSHAPLTRLLALCLLGLLGAAAYLLNAHGGWWLLWAGAAGWLVRLRPRRWVLLLASAELHDEQNRRYRIEQVAARGWFWVLTLKRGPRRYRMVLDRFCLDDELDWRLALFAHGWCADHKGFTKEPR